MESIKTDHVAVPIGSNSEKDSKHTQTPTMLDISFMYFICISFVSLR